MREYEATAIQHNEHNRDGDEKKEKGRERVQCTVQFTHKMVKVIWHRKDAT